MFELLVANLYIRGGLVGLYMALITKSMHDLEIMHFITTSNISLLHNILMKQFNKGK